MHEIKGQEFKLDVMGPYTLKIGDTSNLSDYTLGGVITQVKKPKIVALKPLAEAITCLAEMVVETDFAKFEEPHILHMSYQTLHAFVKKHERVPGAWNTEDALTFLDTDKEMFGEEVEGKEEYIEKFSKICSGDLSPMSAAIGGIVAQEAGYIF